MDDLVLWIIVAAITAAAAITWWVRSRARALPPPPGELDVLPPAERKTVELPERDASGAVTGFAIFQGRVLDVRFRKDVK